MLKHNSDRRPARTANTYQSKKNIIAGRNPVVEALKAGQNIDKILLFKNAGGDSVGEIRTLATQRSIPVQYVPVEKLNSLTNIQHQGVIAFRSAVLYQDLQQVIDWTNAKGEVPLFIMLDGVTDVRNIGAIARSAVCCGAQAIIIPDKGVGAMQEDAIKSSAGALELIQVCRVSSLLKAVDTLHLNGIRVYTSEMKSPVKLADVDFLSPCCFIMGGEEHGIQAFLSKASDTRFYIPMKGDFDSLNVSVAAGIILYEAVRQRG